MLSTARGGVDTELVKRLTIRQILVPIDFSEMSIGAIQPAKNLAQRFQANVHLANICEQFYPAGFYAAPAPAPLSAFTYLETVRRTAAQRLKTLAKERHLSGDCYAQSGAPVFDEICRIAQEIPADLIVTSTHGRTGLKHVVLGSTAERLVQHSPCPVLVARETKTKAKSAKPGIDRILVPVDFSDCSLAGLNYAVQVADKFAATIVILHVVSLGALLTADGYGMYDLSLYEKRAVANAERQMRQFVRRVKFGGTKFETIVESGASVAGICEVARRKHVDLIITATPWTDRFQAHPDWQYRGGRSAVCAVSGASRAVTSASTRETAGITRENRAHPGPAQGVAHGNETESARSRAVYEKVSENSIAFVSGASQD